MLLKNKFLLNSLWLIIEKLYLLLGGLFVTALVARYLGPSNLGLISYGITLSILCTVVSQWGASYYVFNYASQKPIKAILLLLDNTVFRFTNYIICCFFISVFLFYTVDENEFWIILCVCLSNVFVAMDVYQYYFNGTLRSQYNATISMYVKTGSMLLRVLFVLSDLNVYFFIIPFLLEGLIIFTLKHYKSIRESKRLTAESICSQEENVKKYKFSKVLKVKYFPYVLTGLLIVVYSKSIDFSLKEISGFSALGTYSALLALSTAWTFIPLSIGTSLLTKVVSKKSDTALSFLYFCLITVSLPILIFINIFSYEIIYYTFGSEYVVESRYLFLFCCGTLVSTLGFLQNRYIAAMDGERYLLKKTIFVALFCIFVAPVMVLNFSILGAVISYFLVEFFSLTICNYFFRNKSVLNVHLNIFNFRLIKSEFISFNTNTASAK
ncbi:hypothetical protein [Shewanella sp. 10N.286.52.A9]|uniref:hypothetical protein n=1 Tax=Shewanella sp. 10N.286.52.A9 TaxID=3229711 RepID=UPI0035530483